jgi:ParB-like chromosome segregation protein Spo0J
MNEEKKLSKNTRPASKNKGGRLNGTWKDPDDFTIIGLDTNDGPEHELYDDRVFKPLPEGMVANVIALGIQEVVVYRVNGGRKEIIFGRQRVRACREAKKILTDLGETIWPMVPSRTENDLDAAEMMELNISTNTFRMEDSVLAKARKAKQLLRRCRDVKRVAVAFGVDVRSVQNWLLVLKLARPVQDAVEAGEITASAVAPLARLEKKAQAAELRKLLKKANGKRPTAKEVKGAVGQRTGTRANIAPSKKVLKRLLTLEEEKQPLSADFLAGVSYAIGLTDPKTVDGLEQALKAAQPLPAKKRSKTMPKELPTEAS